MFRCTTTITPYRSPPPDEPFVFDPEVHDIKVLTGAIVSELTDGKHMTFTIAAFGREVTSDEGTELMDVLWELPAATDALTSGQPGEFDIGFHDQGGLILTLHYVMAGEEVVITGENPSRELIPRGANPPPERMPRAALAAELRRVAQDVLDAGMTVGAETVGHPLVKDWARRVGVKYRVA